MPDVSSRIGYVKRLELYKTVKPYCLNIPVFPDGKMQNIEYDYVDGITINDIRGHEQEYTLQKHGFELVTSSSCMSYHDFDDKQTIYEKYFPESEQLIKEKLGASRVIVFEHQIRRHKTGFVDNPIAAYTQPLTGAHCDQTPTGMDRRIKLHTGAEADELLKRRRMILNLWRPLRGPVRDYPLAICAFESIDQQNDLQKADLIFPHYE